MPRFFFHSRLQGQTYLDPEGSDLPDLTAALAEATRSARDITADELRRGPLTPGRSFVIVGDEGAVLATIAFHDFLYYASPARIGRGYGWAVKEARVTHSKASLATH